MSVGTGDEMYQAEPVQLLNADNIDTVAHDLPLMVRKALKLTTRLQRGSMEIELPDGRMFHVRGREPGPHGHIKVNDFGFARRLIAEGDVGIAEANLRGEWESRNLTSFLQLFAENAQVIARLLDAQPLMKLWQMLRHWMNANTKRGAKRNIHAHYDIGNAFYSTWLDRTMTYSSAIFEKGDNDLAAAQTRKYRCLAEQTGLQAGEHVLEVGCGWGGFAEYAAKEVGCRVTGLTISQEQFDFARKRMFEAGLADRVEIKLQDYRDETGVYDRIASIEMFEAVGEKFWPVFFQQMRDRLRPGGTAGVQVITIGEEYFDHYRRDVDFIQRYIFPGGMLPTKHILKKLGETFSVPLSGERAFGLDYAETLAQWRDRFRAAWPQLSTMGFDARFKRLWEYYLAYCEAGFRAGTIDVRQMIFARPG
jgi:cyclopropane-fatty-acyl-phospholipid synthase